MKVRKRRQDSLEILRFGEEYIGRFQNEILEIKRNFRKPNFKALKIFFHFQNAGSMLETFVMKNLYFRNFFVFQIQI